MVASILVTKLFVPPLRPKIVHRPRLIKQLNEGLGRKLTLVSAPPGFGKSALVSEWVASLERPVGWLSLDEGDNDPIRFLVYLVAALKAVAARQCPVRNIGDEVLGVLQSVQPPPIEPILIALLNEVTTLEENFIFVLDDYDVIESGQIDQAVTFLIERLPPQMHLVIATREEPNLPLARIRARDQLNELRADDLRFTSNEAAEFLTQVMGLNLSPEDIDTLETRTEGWIAGLQLAAISSQGREDVHGFIRAFAGDNRHIMDYLVEEVLQRQPERIRNFLLKTSILDWLSGPLCDAITDQDESIELLDSLERGNLFVVPLDDKRHWFRYHRLFADILRNLLMVEQPDQVPILHRRASEWYEQNGLEIEAFQHAAAAKDIERAERLLEGRGMPLLFQGAMAPVLNWLESLPTTILNDRPSLLVMYASALTMVGKPVNDIEEVLRAAEAALRTRNQDDRTRDMSGYIAAIRAMLAVSQNQIETIIVQSRRALEYLHPDNLPVRTITTWTLGYAYQLQGDRVEARRAFTEAISISQASGNLMIAIAATTGLGQMQEAENQLYLAAQSYWRVLKMVGDPPWPAACEADLGLARVFYQWNDLDAALYHGQRSLQLARQLENSDTSAACDLLLARLKLAQGDIAGAAASLADAEQFVRQHNFVHWIPDIADTQILLLLQAGHLSAAAHLAQTNELPISQARVHLAQGNPSMALGVLRPLRKKVEAVDWADKRLEVLILESIAHHALGEKDQAVQALGEALSLAEPGGLIRIFVDNGKLVALLLKDTLGQVGVSNYIQGILTAFPNDEKEQAVSLQATTSKSGLAEALSPRELEVLQLIAQGLSNHEISERLFIALDTVKGHNRRIFEKLKVQRRTEAVARAREMDLL